MIQHSNERRELTFKDTRFDHGDEVYRYGFDLENPRSRRVIGVKFRRASTLPSAKLPPKRPKYILSNGDEVWESECLTEEEMNERRKERLNRINI